MDWWRTGSGAVKAGSEGATGENSTVSFRIVLMRLDTNEQHMQRTKIVCSGSEGPFWQTQTYTGRFDGLRIRVNILFFFCFFFLDMQRPTTFRAAMDTSTTRIYTNPHSAGSNEHRETQGMT